MTRQTPYAGTELSAFITHRIAELRPKKSQVEIATEAGFVNPNMVSMIKAGTSKLAPDRVADLAKALETDPTRLFRMALLQSGHETPQRRNLTRPVMRCGTGLHADQARVQLAENVEYSSAPQPPLQDNRSIRIHPVKLEY